MQLEHVLEGVPVIRGASSAIRAADIGGLAYDSRKVGAGYLFCLSRAPKWMARSLLTLP